MTTTEPTTAPKSTSGVTPPADLNVREAALRLALEHLRGVGGTTDVRVVATAKSFEAYLRSGQ